MNQHPFIIPFCGSIVIHGLVLALFFLITTTSSPQEKALSFQVVWEGCTSSPKKMAENKKNDPLKKCTQQKKRVARSKANPLHTSPSPHTNPSQRVKNQGITKIARTVYRPLPTYPWICRKRGEEGTVKIKATLSEEGRVLRATIAQSSGYARLDEAALRAIKTWVLSGGKGDKTLAIAFSLKNARPVLL